MKKLISLLVVLAVGTALVGYGVSHRHHKAPVAAPVIVQTPAEVIEQEHAAAAPPPVPEAPYVITPTDPRLAPAPVPTPKPRVIKKKVQHHVAKPRPQQLAPHCICKA